MIVMINGPFGVGKTSTAELLRARIPNSMIYDPEEVGYMLRNIVWMNALEEFNDFQHIKSWAPLVGEVARQLYRDYQRPMIVPMTLAFPEYFEVVKAGLLSVTPEVHHFCLMASAETIEKRLIERGDEAGNWASQQIPRCLEVLSRPEYATHVDTETLDVEGVVSFILGKVQ